MNKIVISSNTSWNIYNFRLNLIQELKNIGYKVIIVAPYDKYTCKLIKIGFEYYDIFINNKGVNPVEDLRTLKEYYTIYKAIRPNIALHFTIKPNIYGTIAANFLNIKSINNITGLGTVFASQSLITRIAKWLYKYSQNKAYKIFFQNKNDYQMFINEKIVDRDKCDILPGSGVDTQKFKPIKYERNDNIFKFLLIARMIWDKGIGDYVEAAKIIKSKYKNVEFQLLGPIGVSNKNAISKEIIDMWENKGLIKYLGVSNNVKNFIAKSDCIVLPSYYREGIPRALIEAASMCKPIITTNNVGCREIVDDGINGFLCKVKDPIDLAEKMEKMLKLPEEERQKMGKKGREKVLKEFDERIIIDKYLKTIYSLKRED